MSRALLVDQGGDLIAAVQGLLLSEKESLPQSLVIFPGRRPAHFLRRSLAEQLESPFVPPQILSLDEWVNRAYERLGYCHRPLSDIDGVGLLYRLHREREGTSDPRRPKWLGLGGFLPWGFKIFSDFEELAIEQISGEQLRRVQVLAEEKMPPRIQRHLSDLAGLYQDFYQRLSRDGLSTRSSRYLRVAQEGSQLDLSGYRQIILAGFFALTRSEVEIFSGLLAHDQASILLQGGEEGSGIEQIIEQLGVQPVRWMGEGATPGPEIHFYRAVDSHGQVMKLNQLLRQTPNLDHHQVVVLPDPETLFAVVEQALPSAAEGYNISLGYPLLRTPVFTLLQTLGRTVETREGDLYFLPDYLRLVLHPYIKNLFFEGAMQGAIARASYPTRILFHALEEVLTRRQVRYFSLREIEEDPRILKELAGRMAGAVREGVGTEEVAQHLKRIHQMLFAPIEGLRDIGDFCGKLLGLISYVAQHSPAQLHSYSSQFIQVLGESLKALMTSQIGQERMEEVKDYFRLMDGYLRTVRVPFVGTPLKGLQVLGSLETRSLKFETVYFLDANEGVIPPARKADTLLPLTVRRQLGLSTYRQRETIVRHYFENLIVGAREAHIFYSQGEGRERSRLLEGLMWREQKQNMDLKLKHQEEIFFHSDFTQGEPQPIKKTEAMLRQLSDLKFTATSLDAYLRCPLRFYYRFLLHLKEKEGWGEEVEQSEIGKLVHRILKEFFEAKKGQPLRIVQKDYQAIKGLTDQFFENNYGRHSGGSLFLIQSQVKARLRDILDYHRTELHGSIVVECESPYSATIEVTKVGPRRITGKLDRIDRKGDEILIWDYKTGSGGNRMKPGGKFPGSARETWHKTLRSVQLPFYLMLYLANHPDQGIHRIDGALMMLGEKSIKEEHLFNQKVDREALYEEYRKAIYTLMQEIMDPGRDFDDTQDPEGECGRCNYKVLCGRQWVSKRW